MQSDQGLCILHGLKSCFLFASAQMNDDNELEKMRYLEAPVFIINQLSNDV